MRKAAMESRAAQNAEAAAMGQQVRSTTTSFCRTSRNLRQDTRGERAKADAITRRGPLIHPRATELTQGEHAHTLCTTSHHLGTKISTMRDCRIASDAILRKA